MSTKNGRWSVTLFCVKFLVFVIVLVVLWWLVLPYYGQALIQLAGAPLKYVLGMPIESGHIDADGMLNTNTVLTFVVNGHFRGMPIALLVTNLPPYVALVLATAGLGWKRRLRILAYGCGILCFFHVGFIVVALRFQDTMEQVSEIPTAVAQFFLTMPFMLWIVFAYWDRIMSLGQEQPAKVDAPPCSRDDSEE